MVSLLVQTVQGTVEGRRSGGVCAWRGIRYGRPPIGALRFMPPLPPQPWSGVQQADRFGPASLQGSLAMTGGKVVAGRFEEDCLRLNIWSRAADGARRPVMLWVHGGAFLLGSANLFDGTDLAASGEIVVVTINYRLGVLGFVDFGVAVGDGRAPGNSGLRDMIAALAWVRDNIAAFGGDPDRVTIAGESAGSIAVGLLMQCEAARGLFHGAIMQSGAPALIHDRHASRMVAGAFLDQLGLQGASLEELQAVDPERLLAAQGAVQGLLEGGIAAAPFFDGDLLPADALAASRAGTAPVPLLAGFNGDEIRLFEVMPGAILHRRRPQLDQLIRDALGADAQALLDAYPDRRRGNRELASDLYMAMPTLHFAERHSRHAPTWLYRFDLGHPLLGAAHGLELLFVWKYRGVLAALLRGGPDIGARHRLAVQMRRHWTRFVREGQAGADWPAYDEKRRITMLFDRHSGPGFDPQGERRAAWAGQDVATGAATAFAAIKPEALPLAYRIKHALPGWRRSRQTPVP